MNKLLSNEVAPGWALYLLLAITLAGYWPGLAGGWVLDDQVNLAPLANLGDDPTSWYVVLTTNGSGPLGRPLAMLSFAVDQFIHGGEVWSFKYTNLMIHVLCGALIFWLTGRLLQEHRFAPQRWWFALGVSAMWLLTPMQVSTVLYVVQRMTQLSALFVLAGLLCYVIGRQHLEKNRRRGLGLLLSSFMLWMPLAILSKENGALLPLLVFIVEVFFFGFRARPADKRLLIAVYVVFLAVPALAIAGKILLDPAFLLNGYINREFTLTERLLTEPRILFDYIKGLTIPSGAELGIYHDDYVKSTGLLSPITTAVSIAAWLIILVLSYLARARPVAVFFFGPLFFFGAHLMESTVFGLELYFEHRNYLASYGLFLSLAMLFYYLMQHFRWKKTFVVFLIALPATHAAASYQRILTWTSFESILLSAEQSHPESLRVHGELAIFYYNRRDFDQAVSHLDRVQELDPSSTSSAAMHRMVAHCLCQKDIPEAEYKRLQAGLYAGMVKYLIPGIRQMIGVVKHNQCPQLNVDYLNAIFDQWLHIYQTQAINNAQGRIQWWLLNIQMAQLLEYSGRYSLAIPYLDRAAALYPNRLESGLLKLRYQLMLGDLNGARRTLTDTMQNDRGDRPDYSEALRVYEKSLHMLGDGPTPAVPLVSPGT
ncbi:MAG: hypothetical protein HY942_04770 [Gammaproteobacteria bacterium]|nr:hypothetical protein [Gammaproteobacteria bacterium]